MQLVFQQSKSYVFFALPVPCDRVLDIPVVPQKGDSTVQSLNKVVAVVEYDSCPLSSCSLHSPTRSSTSLVQNS